MKLIRYVFLTRVRAAVRTMTKVSAGVVEAVHPDVIRASGTHRVLNAGVDLPQPLCETTQQKKSAMSGKHCVIVPERVITSYAHYLRRGLRCYRACHGSGGVKSA